MVVSEFYKNIVNANIPLIIAEIGANYGGIDNVKKMVCAASDCGADMVKFQTYTAETISTPGSYFTFEDGQKVSQFDFFKSNELNLEHHITLDNLCKKKNIQWTSTPSHSTDLELLDQFNLPCYKVGSDDLTNVPFLRKIAKLKKPIILSTGMCSLSEIEKACSSIIQENNYEIILLHCVVSYPSKVEDANLNVIKTLKNAFGFPVGLSDHTQDELTSILATQMGACIIEKHFTLDHKLKLPDHQASLDPDEFKLLVDRVKSVNLALGNGLKNIQDTEIKWRKAGRKSLFAAVDIDKGTIIKENHIEIRRPSDGLHPHDFDSIVGRKAKQFIAKNTIISWDMF